MGGIGHLGKELLEVIEQGLFVVGEDRQWDVHPHGGGGLRPGACHREDGVFHILIGITEGLLQPGQLLLGVAGHLFVGDRQVLQPDEAPVQPLAVGLAGGVGLLQLRVINDTPLDCIHQQHLPRLQPGFLHDLPGVQVQGTHLGGEDQLTVVSDIVPGGAQPVPVQHRSHGVAVGEQDGGRTIPGLHHDGVILVQVPLGPADTAVLGPGLRDGDHHREGQVHAAHDQELQGVVQHGRVGPGPVDHRVDLVQGVIDHRVGHGLLPGQHPVCVAPDGVDLAVVEDQAVRVGPLPGGIGVGGEAGVNACDGAVVVPTLQVQVELPQFPHQEHPLIYHCPAGQGGDIGVVVGLLKDSAGHIQPAVELQSPGRIPRPLHEGLLDVGHLGQCLLAQHLWADRHLPPAQKFHAFLGHNDLEHLLSLIAPESVLGKEKHTYAIVPRLPQLDAALRGRLLKKLVGDLEEDAHAVTGLSLSVLSRSMLQLLHDFQRTVHRLIALAALDVHHGSDAAGIVLKRRVIQAALLIAFSVHLDFPFPGQLTKIRQSNSRTAAARLRCLSHTHIAVFHRRAPVPSLVILQELRLLLSSLGISKLCLYQRHEALCFQLWAKV